ncbi:Precorrin-2 oxidase (EC 1.3.1.76) @ Sirohydrochlorin ferrochelatase activity of CysG (EC 4.99.1.4) / Uroporphyrinogen-III methyltransferase (EC 2.1.1.107) [uncultured Gammaproteobacteria bacterium]|jgi:uroporphyrin-III C-methyltransferase/precorrin-2 dehydrogenase/sirohydrochlorin ferrochelatase|uniref:Siroheme synthase n=2 Tax=sulfur-oxidizing symbionts TaxID=32036 RepID=A0A1H6MD61_9GAMM|nr:MULTISPECIES: siroheme synthase CysG [sulfur-oxidizing symbionts]CAC9496905.1 Precorrin-2 oxidase (EC 1.3.1.76) @ Sirohydrochlorin ferrochelatase activity of CysG (EC 4.99.1.4) / Uroporphyrinogen-III methyltransferase (EC 2.1.1.107) [uncultured Gammaproteobacteria bacterium]CAB5502182.1 Precorrin-2 oxidase (EC @ Sirohydrochlorin ferrochelatase activity of CysG (EC / Uroporphyrinogen-III methyltransferase (EC [Bathymodiolus thermophilus thioautotrophic gill symbiont]CAC9532698.1 Precorrin-2 ox
MNYLPIFINITQKPCLVVGGGDIAYRKINLLLKANAQVSCVAQACCNGVTQLAKNNTITVIEKAFEPSDIKSQVLIVSATNDRALNAQVSDLAKNANIPVNVVDSPDLCTFIMPSIVDRSPIVIAISSAGKAPVLARLIRAKLESTIPNAYGKLAELAGSFRAQVKAKFNNIEDRRYFWEKAFSGVVAEKVFSGKTDEAELDLQTQLDKSTDSEMGEVYLVGGGPGDPDLLTFKALRLMQQADVILYDRLVSDEVMELVRRDAELIYVGKERDNHSVPQDGINQLLVDLAKQGRRVCRLKGGDPFIFGRGGEEIETLAENGVPFQVVPGITAASGCSTYSGIPLTHRDYSQSCRFVTGHLKDGTMNLPWDELAVEQQTIVFYMALKGSKHLSEQLQAHGMRGDMPVALVEKGTTPEHKVHTTTLAKLPDLVANETIHAPTLIIVGEVVKLREKLNWFDAES